jgi:hypothetical protein
MKVLREHEEQLVDAFRVIATLPPHAVKAGEIIATYCEKLFELYRIAACSLIKQSILTAQSRIGFEYKSTQCEKKAEFIVNKHDSHTLESVTSTLFTQNIVSSDFRNIYCEIVTADRFCQLRYTFYINKATHE